MPRRILALCSAMLLVCAISVARPALAEEAAAARATTGEAAGPAVVYSVALTARPTGASLVLDLSREVDYAIRVLRQPDRIVIDLPKVVFAANGSKPPGRVGPVAAYRYGLFFADRSRIVLDLAEPAVAERVDSIETAGRRRLAFHLSKTDRARFSAAIAEAAAESPAVVASVPPSSGTDGKAPRRPLVVIDPGHGGIDPGATTESGETEKSVVMALALELRKVLTANNKVDVAMTRDTDVFISLGDRVRFARDRRAALLVSLHADTLAYEPGVRGASIYTLSEKASDVLSQKLADSENRADQAAGLDSQEEDTHVGDILFDLTKRETRHFSIKLARQLGETLPRTTLMHKNPLRSAGFRVLTAPDVPSVLIEVGYLSSSEDMRSMKSAEWRGNMALAVAAAVENFVGENATAVTNSAAKP